MQSLTTFLNTWQNNKTYFDMLRLMSSLSKLFSDNPVPYLDYRLAENLFCKYYNAQNDARDCTAYDAHFSDLGIGVKTFGIENYSSEKVAEFNKLRTRLNNLVGVELAHQISNFRNERIEFANNLYNVNNSLYHIVGRQKGCLKIFNTSYEKINIDNIVDVEDNETSICFNDGINEYSFNKSKSVLFKKFYLPKEYVDVPVDIIDEPFELLASLLNVKVVPSKPIIVNNAPLGFSDSIMSVPSKPIIVQSYKPEVKGYDYVILPLYSNRGGYPNVPERSGLNQWNANGRKRDANEIYIPIPQSIHHNYPDFFPQRDFPFELHLPDGTILSAKVCQEGGKALMSNPNSALGQWLLRKILRKREGELITIDDLYRYGIDSIKVISTHKKNSAGEKIYKIKFSNSDYEDYSSFINE